MKKILEQLHQHKLLNIVVAFIYFLLVTLPHEEVGKLIAGIFENESRDYYNAVILSLTLAGMVAYLAYLYFSVRTVNDQKKLIGFYLLATLVLSIVCFKLLIVINIEAIHFIQYAVMAILVFPLVCRYGETLFWVTLLGALDEAYQYFHLSPERTDYYDFNDDVINLIGGAFGLILIKAAQPGFALGKRENIFKSPVFYTTVSLSVIISILLTMNWLHITPPADDPNAFWSLIRVPTEGFWTTIHPNITYHVMQPLEGVIVMGLLLWFYSGLGRR